MTKDMVAVVAAASPSRGIGYRGQLPWKLPTDLKHFAHVTTTPPAKGKVNAVVMGRKTWESLPSKFRPLPHRINVILTRQQQYQQEEHVLPSTTTTSSSGGGGDDGARGENPPMVLVASSLPEAAEQLQQHYPSTLGHVFVIGGAELYATAIEQGWVNDVIYTEITNLPDTVQLDTFFPPLDASEWNVAPYRAGNAFQSNHVDADASTSLDNKENTVQSQEGSNDNNNHPSAAPLTVDLKSGLSFRLLHYTRRHRPSSSDKDERTTTTTSATRNTEEWQYLQLCQSILRQGVRRGDRTGTGTLSLFGTQMRFSLRHGRLPLLTTKRTFWRGVAEELLWFIQGNTNANDLAAKNIHIWDGNGSREFLDQRGLSHREVGDLGPVYGFQWRHFGAKYVDMHTDYTGQGVDQLAECIDKIKNSPEDRRIIMSAWNPADLDLMALPPCHMFCQFYVDTERNELSCQMYQRSADMGLGVPFNIASYALLTHMIAHVTGRQPGDFIHTIGDAHIYLNHVDALQEQLKREPRDFPTLRINPAKTNIDDFVFEDLEVIGYNPHKPIKMEMAV